MGDLFREPLSIVKEAALAHLAGNYFVSVPLFTIHSEGVIRESFPKKWMKQSTIRESMEEAIQQRVSNEELLSIVQNIYRKKSFEISEKKLKRLVVIKLYTV